MNMKVRLAVLAFALLRALTSIFGAQPPYPGVTPKPVSAKVLYMDIWGLRHGEWMPISPLHNILSTTQ